jgi:hypothetical protein
MSSGAAPEEAELVNAMAAAVPHPDPAAAVTEALARS